MRPRYVPGKGDARERRASGPGPSTVPRVPRDAATPAPLMLRVPRDAAARAPLMLRVPRDAGQSERSGAESSRRLMFTCSLRRQVINRRGLVASATGTPAARAAPAQLARPLRQWARCRRPSPVTAGNRSRASTPARGARDAWAARVRTDAGPRPTPVPAGAVEGRGLLSQRRELGAAAARTPPPSPPRPAATPGAAPSAPPARSGPGVVPASAAAPVAGDPRLHRLADWGIGDWVPGALKGPNRLRARGSGSCTRDPIRP